jgi:hypothetical protein
MKTVAITLTKAGLRYLHEALHVKFHFDLAVAGPYTSNAEEVQEGVNTIKEKLRDAWMSLDTP